MTTKNTSADFRIEFGAMSQPVSLQLKKQGHHISRYSASRFQKMADAICLLKVHGLIDEKASLRAREKLMGKIGNAIREETKP